MKNRIRHSFLLGLLLFTALFSMIPSEVFAAGNSVYLTPASGTSQPGNTFTVSADGFVAPSAFGTYNINGQITFPTNLLKVNSISAGGATFHDSSTVTVNDTTGVISFNQGNWFFGANNQSIHLFTITFQSLTNGIANVNYKGVSYSTGVTSMTGGVYTISTPPPPPSPSPTPTPSSTPKPSNSPKPSTTPKPSITPTPTPTPSATPTPEETPTPVTESDGGLKIENVKVTTTRQVNSIAWSLNNTAATPTLVYGTTKSSQKSNGEVIKLDDGTYSVKLGDLKLGTLYYFTIKAATDNNLLGANYSGAITTRGYPVQLTVEQNNLFIPGAKVKIGERTFVANKNAIITTELGDGAFTAIVTPAGTTDSYNAHFTVKKISIPSGGNPTLQSFTLNIATVGSSSGLNSSLIPTIVGGTVATIAAIGGLVGFLIFRKRKNEAERATQVDSDLLNASYGEEVVQRRENTPVPNLETAQAASPPALGTINEPLPSTELPPEQNSFTPPPQTTPIDPVAAAPVSPYLDPSSFPLPPTTESPAIQQTYANDAPPIPQESIEAEEYSQAVTQVESSEQPVDNEPSAVYDEATGELEIIHHHTPHTSATPVTAMTPLEVPNNITTQMDSAPEQPDPAPVTPSTLLQSPENSSESQAPPQTPIAAGPQQT